MRNVLIIVGLTFLPATHVAAQDTKPNFVLIMADDLGYGDLSCYGGEIPTPAMDQLAKQGVRFTDFHSSGNVCSPTRAGLVTGRYQQRVGVPGVINADPKLPVHHTGLVPEETTTFAELLGGSGYSTAVMGKWHLGYKKKFNPMHHGFNRFRGFVSGNIDYLSHYDRMEIYDWWSGLEHVQEAGYSTHLITQHAVDFIAENWDQPFCLYVAHEAVHDPWQGPNDPIVRGPNKQATKADLQKQRAFREMLIELDRSVASIIKAIDEHKLADNTLLMFFSDNGPAGGSAGPLRGRKGSNWEGGHRVPAIARWPGKIAPATTNKQLCITLDVMPTMLAAAKVDLSTDHDLDGLNLIPVMTKGKKFPDRKLYWNGKAMRHGPWKLITPKKQQKPQLYNLDDDLAESKDLSKQNPDRAAAMRRDIQKWIAEVTP